MARRGELSGGVVERNRTHAADGMAVASRRP